MSTLSGARELQSFRWSAICLYKRLRPNCESNNTCITWLEFYNVAQWIWNWTTLTLYKRQRTFTLSQMITWLTVSPVYLEWQRTSPNDHTSHIAAATVCNYFRRVRPPPHSTVNYLGIGRINSCAVAKKRRSPVIENWEPFCNFHSTRRHLRIWHRMPLAQSQQKELMRTGDDELVPSKVSAAYWHHVCCYPVGISFLAASANYQNWQ